MGIEEEGRRKEIKKHVATIHCANTLSLLQRKISNVLLFHAYPHLKMTEEHHITVKQLCNAIEYVGHNTAAVKEAFKGLLSMVIEWDVFDDITQEEDWTASSILASVRIKGSNCWYSYSPRMRELLYSPSVYAKINLIVQSKFKSSYGLALYENCVRYHSLPYTKWFKLDLFRKLMGVPKETYQIFRDFKRRVLDKAIEEVNYYSDLHVTPEIERAGHKVISIRFKLNERQKRKWLAPMLQSSSEKLKLIEKLVNDFKFETTKANEVIDAYGILKVLNKIDYVESTKSFVTGRINNTAGYLIQALKEDYQDANPSQLLMNGNAIIEEKHMQEKMEEKKKQALEKKYLQYVAEEFDKMLDNLSRTHYQQLMESFEETLKVESIFYFKKFKLQGLQNKVVKSHLRKYINEHFPALVPKMLSFEEFTPIS